MIKWKKSTVSVIILLTFLLVYLILDYVNIFGFFSLNIRRINTDYLSILINSMVVICIAIFTFVFIDKKQINKQVNQENAAKLLLKMIYENCEDNISIFDDEDFAKKLISKVDFNSLDIEKDPVRKIEKSAFENEHLIMNAFMDGVLEKEHIECYFAMKKAYRFFMTVRVTFFDHPKIYERERDKFEQNYKIGLSLLEEK